MTTSISTKFAALGLALALNSALLGGVAVLFTTHAAHAAVLLVAANRSVAVTAAA
jgi:hypothetical protein